MSGRPRVRSWIVLRSLVAEAAANLRSRRLQAVLSAFGIATGIAAVVLLVALVSGLHRMALRTFNAAGGSLVEVFVQADESTRDPGGFPRRMSPGQAAPAMPASCKRQPMPWPPARSKTWWAVRWAAIQSQS